MRRGNRKAGRAWAAHKAAGAHGEAGTQTAAPGMDVFTPSVSVQPGCMAYARLAAPAAAHRSLNRSARATCGLGGGAQPGSQLASVAGRTSLPTTGHQHRCLAACSTRPARTAEPPAPMRPRRPPGAACPARTAGYRRTSSRPWPPGHPPPAAPCTASGGLRYWDAGDASAGCWLACARVRRQTAQAGWHTQRRARPASQCAPGRRWTRKPHARRRRRRRPAPRPLLPPAPLPAPRRRRRCRRSPRAAPAPAPE